MTLVIYTASLGGCPYPIRVPEVIDRFAHYVCFTDGDCPAPYQRVWIDPTDNPRLASRRIKILADHPALAGADALLWHDASYRLTRRTKWVPQVLQAADLALMRHPRLKRRIEEEAEVIARYGYLPLVEAQAHIARYRDAGYADQALHSGGLIARRVTPAVQRFAHLWWTEAQLWGGRDQASLGYAAWAAGLRVQHLQGEIKNNPYALWREDERVEVAV